LVPTSVEHSLFVCCWQAQPDRECITTCSEEKLAGHFTKEGTKMDNIKRYQLDDQIKEITVDQYKWFVKPSVILKSHREERHGTKY